MTAPGANRRVHTLEREVARLQRANAQLAARLDAAAAENKRLKATIRGELAAMRAKLAEVQGVSSLLRRAVPQGVAAVAAPPRRTARKAATS